MTVGTSPDSEVNSGFLRPIVILDLDVVNLNLSGSGSSGNPYTLSAK